MNKFRGKRIDNGEWVYGHFIAYRGKSFIFTKKRKSFLAGFVEVHPNSVGMYVCKCETGDVYSNDIITCEFEDGQIKTGVIKYFETHMSFVLTDKANRNIGKTRNMWHVSDTIKELPKGGIKGKVIGNTTDNKELLAV